MVGLRGVLLLMAVVSLWSSVLIVSSQTLDPPKRQDPPKRLDRAKTLCDPKNREDTEILLLKYENNTDILGCRAQVSFQDLLHIVPNVNATTPAKFTLIVTMPQFAHPCFNNITRLIRLQTYINDNSGLELDKTSPSYVIAATDFALASVSLLLQTDFRLYVTNIAAKDINTITQNATQQGFENKTSAETEELLEAAKDFRISEYASQHNLTLKAATSLFTGSFDTCAIPSPPKTYPKITVAAPTNRPKITVAYRGTTRVPPVVVSRAVPLSQTMKPLCLLFLALLTMGAGQ